MRRGALVAVLGLLAGASPAAAGECASRLAACVLAEPPAAGSGAGATRLHGAAGVPGLWLAQRAIEREWGPSEDSLYRTVEVREWKLEGLALALSSAVPGAGQLYVGEGSGWLYLAAEALGWAGRTITRRRGDSLRDDAIALIGNPADTAAHWSFERYATATGDDAGELRTLWEQDRDAFYESLARDSRYRFGFSGSDVLGAYERFRGAHESSQDRYRQSRYLEIALWANHAVAAFDALRAARFHNLPLRRDLELRLSGRAGRDGGELRATLVRRF
jgi:hypothetical protein